MTPEAEQYARVQELFQAAIDLPPGERDAFLTNRCGTDQALRSEVESLLRADAQADRLEQQIALEVPDDLFPDETEQPFIGRHFGPYEIIREIGRGGLGAVFLASRFDGEYRKEVAIKLIRRGLDTEDILRRFRTERQILAQLDHPNIARLIDGGTTDDGLPYFAMEYVKGEPITVYCDSRHLGTDERLDLFRKVCAAVTYAHQNLVVHRDLKPSNILVTPEGEPKLLDFGIAKLLLENDESLTQTAPGMRAMTPDYASPEQVRGGRITTASDVYALGVLLYELLTGRKPYRLTTRTSEEISRAITEQEPSRPSSVAPRQEALNDDLDNIVLTAMRKEPEHRYSSPSALADDIQRFQDGLPVSARPSTLAYRSVKFVRRHKAGVAAATLVLLALLGGIAATLRQARIAESERAKAERRFNDVRKLANANIFDVYPEVENLQGSLKAREIILRNALTYLDSLATEAHDDAQLQSELATAYEKVGDVQGALNTSSLGKTKAALESYGKAGKLREAVLKQDPTLSSKESLANNYYTAARTLWNNSQTVEAEAAFEKALTLQRELVANKPDSVPFRNRLAVLLIDYGAIPVFNFQAEKAVTMFNEALGIIEQLQRQDSGNVEVKKTRARCLRILSKAKGAVGDHNGGRAALDEALVISRELAQQFPDDFRIQRSVWLTQSMTCELLIDKRDAEEATSLCTETIAFPEAALRKEPENGVVAYDLAISHFNTARAFGQAKKPEQNIEQAKKAIEVMSQLSAKSPENTEYKRNLAIYKTSLARAEIEVDRIDEAIAAIEDARQTLRPIVEADITETTYQYDLGFAARIAGQAYARKKDYTKAIELADEALATFSTLKDAKALRESDKELLDEVNQERSGYVAAAAAAR